METTEKIINGTEACFLASVRDGKIQFFAPICNGFTDIIITKGEDFNKMCISKNKDVKVVATIMCKDEYVLLNDLPDETTSDINKLIIARLRNEDIIFSIDGAIYVVSFAD